MSQDESFTDLETAVRVLVILLSIKEKLQE